MVTSRRGARLLAGAGVALVLTVGGPSAAAFAACEVPPEPQQPTQALQGFDSGPLHPTGSDYSTFGWGGLRVVTYESNLCVGGVTVGSPRPDMQTRAANFALWFATAVAVVATVLARWVFAPDLLWQAVSTALAPFGIVLPPAFIGLLLTLAAFVLLVWGTFRLLRDEATAHKDVRSKTLQAAFIVGAAIVCLSWTVAIPRAHGAAISVSLAAVQQGATGQVGAADVAIADAFTNNILAPVWARAQLGPNPEVVQQYGWRLRAASTLTREEERRVADDPAAYEELVEQKNADYQAVSAEIKASHPSSYARHAGHQTDGRAGTAGMGFVMSLLSGGVILVTLGAVLVARVVLPIAVYLFPGVAPLLMLPGLQWLAGEIGKSVLRWTFAAFAGGLLFVLWMIGPMRALVPSDATPTQKAFTLLVLYIGLSALWRRRRAIAERAGLVQDLERARDAAHIAVDEVRASFGRSRGGGPVLAGPDRDVQDTTPESAQAGGVQDDTPRIVVTHEVPDVDVEVRYDPPSLRSDAERDGVEEADLAPVIDHAAEERRRFEERVEARYVAMESDEIKARAPEPAAATEPPPAPEPAAAVAPASTSTSTTTTTTTTGATT